MKTLRIITLILVLVLLAGWAPAPDMFNSGNPSTLAIPATPSLFAPALGELLSPNTDFMLQWVYNPAMTSYEIQVSSSSTFATTATYYYTKAGIVPLDGDTTLIQNPKYPDNPNAKLVNFAIPESAILPNKFPARNTISNLKLYWRVRAKVGTANSYWAARYFTIKPIKLDPTTDHFVPGSATLTGSDPMTGAPCFSLRPTLTFDKTTDATSFKISLYDGKTNALKTSATVKAVGPQVSWYVPITLAQNYPYKWTVQAIGATTGVMSDPAYIVTPGTPPNAPTLLSPATGSMTAPNGQISYLPTLTWKPAAVFYLGNIETDQVTYMLQVATASTFAADKLIYDITTPAFDVVPASNPSHTLDAANFIGPMAGKDELEVGTYYWRVRTIDKNNVLSNTWSTVFSFKTPPSLELEVTDFLTGNSILGATVKITAWPGKGTIPYSTTTSLDPAESISPYRYTRDGNKLYFKPFPTGTHKVTISYGTDYLVVNNTITYYAGKAYIATYDNLKRQPIKAVLKWGKGMCSANDLNSPVAYCASHQPVNPDIHIWMPTEVVPAPADPVELKHIYPQQRGYSTKFPWMYIAGDVSGVSSTYKTETATMYNRYPGTYLIAVYHNGTGDSYGLGQLFGSGATVEITVNNQSTNPLNQKIKVISDPNDLTDTAQSRWWIVAEIIVKENGTVEINPVNEIQTEYPGPFDPGGGVMSFPPEPQP